MIDAFNAWVYKIITNHKDHKNQRSIFYFQSIRHLSNTRIKLHLFNDLYYKFWQQ